MNRGAEITYPNTCFGGLGVGKAHACHAVWFPVEENDVGDFAEFGTLVADVFFDLEYRGGIFLEWNGASTGPVEL